MSTPEKRNNIRQESPTSSNQNLLLNPFVAKKVWQNHQTKREKKTTTCNV